MRRKAVSWDNKAQEAAYLYAQYNMSQEAIGAELGCSQPQVSRLLKDAEKRGWLRTEVRFVSEGISQQRMEEIQRLLEPRELVDALRNLASISGVSLTVKVFDSGRDRKYPEEYQEQLKMFGRAAAGRMQELLRNARTVGVTWGKTLTQMIEVLTSSGSYTKQEPPIQFVPVCAELVRLEDIGIEYSSSRLAHRLSEVINHKQVDQLSLTGIPAFLPRYRGREKKDVELLHKYLIDKSPSYKKIFTVDSPLIEHVDTVLTSVGSFSDLYPSRVKPELSMVWGDDAGKVEALILGDFGGVLIPKPNLSIQDRKLVEEMNHMWTGLKMSHLERLARITSANKNRSTVSGSGNVVVGARKAAVIHEAVRLGLVNEIIIDRALAGELEQTFQRTKQTQINTSP